MYSLAEGVFSGTSKAISWWQDAELDGLLFWCKGTLFYWHMSQKAQLLEQTVLVPSVPCTGSVVIPWIVLHTASLGFFSLAFRNRSITVPAILVLEALWLDAAELFYWLLATRTFLPILKIFPVCWNFQCFPLPCHCCGHSCGWWWLFFVTPDTAYASQCRRCRTELPGHPAKRTACPWHDIKKRRSSQFFLSPLQPSVCYFYLVQLLQEEAVLPLWTVETCSLLLWASRFQTGTAVPYEDLMFKMVTFDLPHGTSVMPYSSRDWKMENRNNTIIPNSMMI